MILKKADKIRKKLMPKLTQRIGKNHFNRKVKGSKKSVIHKILVCRPNQRLGNILLVTPLIQELEAFFPNCEIDIIVKGGVAKPVLKEYSSIKDIIILPRKPFKEIAKYLKIFFSVKFKKYDLVVNGDEGSSSGKILTYLSNAKYKVFGKLDNYNTEYIEDYTHMAKHGVYNLRHYLECIGYDKTLEPIPDLNIKLTDTEIFNGSEIIHSLVNDPYKKTITIFTYATGNKCYSKDWWSSFYEKLKTEYSNDYNILEILPMENVSQIDFKATTYYSKDIRKISSVIANSELFIGADSGIMHLASASQVNTLGLFSVTNIKKYRPYNLKSKPIDTNTNDFDACLKIVNQTLDQNHHLAIF